MTKRITVKPEDQLKEIERGVSQILPRDEFLKKLEKSFEKDEPLRIKFGADPSRPDLHLGHTVVINKLKVLQDFGHDIYFLIGDFTARIGDPTGKSKTRPILTAEDVINNANTYKEQIFKILDPEKTKIVFNYKWLSKLSPIEMIKLASKVTVASMLERDDFTKRYKAEQPIYMHEFMYPLMQGYDSVELKSDLELGGTDQTFNLMVGRDLQKSFEQRPQSILTLPILEGTDGVEKMSKSLDNYIGVTDAPGDMFGKLMSISDDLMIRYYELLSPMPYNIVEQAINNIKTGKTHPMEAKKELAVSIVNVYHTDQGYEERKKFEERFSKNKIPDDIKTFTREAGTIPLFELLREMEFIESNGEGKRLLKQNAIKINNKAQKDNSFTLISGEEYIVKVGKLRMGKVVVN